MVDSNKLKIGNIVIIEDEEYKVIRVSDGTYSTGLSCCNGTLSLAHASNIWKHAELKKKPLPSITIFGKTLYPALPGQCVKNLYDFYFPTETLREAREIVRALEEAGVK